MLEYNCEDLDPLGGLSIAQGSSLALVDPGTWRRRTVTGDAAGSVGLAEILAAQFVRKAPGRMSVCENWAFARTC